MAEKRPILEITKTSYDHFIVAIGLIALAILICLPFLYFNALPDRIPTHYGVDGKPDDFGGKSSIFLLPAIGLVLYLLITWAAKRPHKFNYSVKITADNAAFQYQNGTRLVQFFQTTITVALAVINWNTIMTTLGKSNGLGAYFLPVFMSFMIGGMIYFAYQSAAKK